MTTSKAKCHPDRPLKARGMCEACYSRWWRRRKRQGPPKPLPARLCRLCRYPFTPATPRREFCCELCGRVHYSWARTRRTGKRPAGEDLYATRDPAFARQLARACRDRGMRRIAPNGAGAMTHSEAYYCAWRRAGGLYLFRVRWPAEEEEAA